MFLVVGLGNPGREYAAHRHNVGFMAVDELARRARADAFREKFSGEWTKGEIAGEPAVFLKPMTYMNESGRSVQPAMAFFKVAPADVLVVHDELDLPFGDVRLKMGGGHAGHNGSLRTSLMSCAGGEFARVRIGVGRPPAGFRGEVADFVLSGFDATERAALPDVLKKAVDAVIDVADRGFSAAMNARNARPKPPKPPKEPKPAVDAPDESGRSRKGARKIAVDRLDFSRSGRGYSAAPALLLEAPTHILAPGSSRGLGQEELNEPHCHGAESRPRIRDDLHPEARHRRRHGREGQGPPRRGRPAKRSRPPDRRIGGLGPPPARATTSASRSAAASTCT